MQQPDSRGWWCVMKRDEWWSSEVEIDFLGRGVQDLRPGTAQAFPAFRCGLVLHHHHRAGLLGRCFDEEKLSKDRSGVACLVCPGQGLACCVNPGGRHWPRAVAQVCESHQPQLNFSTSQVVGCDWNCKKAALRVLLLSSADESWTLTSAEDDTSVALREGGRDCPRQRA